MSNPFEKEASALQQKREEWDRLTLARQWIVSHYDPDDLIIDTRHFAGSGVHGNKAAMSCIVDFLMAREPTKADILAWIDSQLKELTK